MTQRLRKVVFPVAGLGTRFLPASKVVAKEMLPVLDKPLIQYAVDEAVDAGADTLIFVTNRYKHAISDYFDVAFELEHKLEKSGKKELLAAVQNVLPKNVRCVFVTQAEALGLGHAVLCAKPVVGDEPFGVILPDDLIWNRGRGALAQMADFALSRDAGAIAVEEVPREDTNKYGIV
ncbi:MAG TPA: UTP--glucose-1-phosphate uridylyltransferase, partial [Rudaea sp.]